MSYVLDASVLVKWLFADPVSEPLTNEATALLTRLIDDDLTVLQPIHWLAEVGGAMARKTPDRLDSALQLLDSLSWLTLDSLGIMRKAGQLAVQLDHHFFDTLYHAVALERNATLITADYRYLNKARHLGNVTDLEYWRELLD